MKFLELKNEKVLSILNQYNECFKKYHDTFEKFAIDIPNLEQRKVPCPVSDAHPGINSTSEQYLKLAMEYPEFYKVPAKTNLIEIMRLWDNPAFASAAKDLKEFRSEIHLILSKLQRYLGLHHNALSAYYPDNGYIGWHHNGDAYGWNVLFTYSQDGDGYFKYRDIDSGKLITLQDKTGWSCKVGYYPQIKGNTNSEQLFWHTAASTKKRYTFAFVFHESDMWETLRDIIETR